MLVPLIKTIQFFKERDIKEQDYIELVSCLTYEQFQVADNVFEYGKFGAGDVLQAPTATSSTSCWAARCRC